RVGLPSGLVAAHVDTVRLGTRLLVEQIPGSPGFALLPRLFLVGPPLVLLTARRSSRDPTDHSTRDSPWDSTLWNRHRPALRLDRDRLVPGRRLLGRRRCRRWRWR